MLSDHRPYFVKRLYLRYQKAYTRHFLSPQFTSLGPAFNFIKPWHIELFGAPIHVGRHANIIAAPDRKVRLSVWSNRKDCQGIRIGDFCLICPGVRISSAIGITIEDNCMIASQAYLTDADWHGIYNRVNPGHAAAIHIRENAWIGDSAIICKGVTIGANSIIGAGAVVRSDIPPNTVAAGNPAQVVRHLDPDKKFTKRSNWYLSPNLYEEIDRLDRANHKHNTIAHWLRYLAFPRTGD